MLEDDNGYTSDWSSTLISGPADMSVNVEQVVKQGWIAITVE